MIRRAVKDDFPYVNKLIMMASRLVFEDALKTKNDDEIFKLAKKYFLDENTKFSYTNTYVYEVNEVVAACIIYYDSSNEEMYNSVMESYLDNNYKFPIEGIQNSVYLDTIAVFNEFQGMKISKKLIEFVISKEDKCISLLAESHKKFVVDYYLRLGFKEMSENKIYNQMIKTMLYTK